MSEPLRLLSPQIGIVTTIGDDYYAAFRTREATALEKGKLVECLPPEGTAILNADDPVVRGMAECTRARVMTYGVSGHADLRGSEISSRCQTASHSRPRMRRRLRGLKPGWWANIGLRRRWLRLPVRLGPCDLRGRREVHRAGFRPVLGARGKAPYWTIPSALRLVANAPASRKTVLFGTISDYAGAGGARYRRAARDAL